jgi:hypothetical protein
MFRHAQKTIILSFAVLLVTSPAAAYAAGTKAQPAHPVAAHQQAAAAHRQELREHAAESARWRADHPRRDEVNARLAVQNARIDAKERAGKVTPAMAAALHKDDHQIRVEEQAMASQHDTHLTKPEDRQLNQQEDQISRELEQ